MSGRNIYIVDLATVIAARGLATFLRRAEESHFSAIWIRLGRGAGVDKNLTHPDLPLIQAVLKNIGVQVWGWHVPFCQDAAAATAEAEQILQLVDQYLLDGVVLDAERTSENPRFQGGVREVDLYAGRIAAGMRARNKPVALSSHDQPSLHRDLPFEGFLRHIDDVCPQIYYRSLDVATRFEKSVRDYKALLPARDFIGRYKPTGNITVSADLPHPDPKTAIAAAARFTQLVTNGGFFAHSFWCWDAAPDEIWHFFRTSPV